MICHCWFKYREILSVRTVIFLNRRAVWWKIGSKVKVTKVYAIKYISMYAVHGKVDKLSTYCRERMVNIKLFLLDYQIVAIVVGSLAVSKLIYSQ